MKQERNTGIGLLRTWQYCPWTLFLQAARPQGVGSRAPWSRHISQAGKDTVKCEGKTKDRSPGKEQPPWSKTGENRVLISFQRPRIPGPQYHCFCKDAIENRCYYVRWGLWRAFSWALEASYTQTSPLQSFLFPSAPKNRSWTAEETISHLHIPNWQSTFFWKFGNLRMDNSMVHLILLSNLPVDKFMLED